MLGDEELLKSPYSIENQVHRRTVLAELDRLKALGVKPPQNLWEYKVSTRKVRLRVDYFTYFFASSYEFKLNIMFCKVVVHLFQSQKVLYFLLMQVVG